MTGASQINEPPASALDEGAAPIQPYRSTPVFTEATLPAGLRAD
jgi:hypothetical protein